MLVADPLIGDEQADFVGNGLAKEGREGGSLNVRNDTGDDVALAAYRTCDRRLTGAYATRTAAAALVLKRGVVGEGPRSGRVRRRQGALREPPVAKRARQPEIPPPHPASPPRGAERG